jgi:transcription antitermination factor NusG
MSDNALRPADAIPHPEFRASHGPRWHVLWTHSACEQLVHDQLSSRGFELFLPMMDAWRRRGGTRRHVRVPMFPGYLFLRHAVDKRSYLDIVRARGLARILGEGWDRLAVVPDREIESIRKVHEAKVPVLPHAHLREGERVRITAGLLAGAEGILVRKHPTKGLLILSIALLQQSVAAEVDCTMVEPA